jgi:hypothetical protein
MGGTMPFTLNDQPVKSFDGTTFADCVDIGAVCRADTEQHTGAIYIAVTDSESKQSLTFVIEEDEINSFLRHVAKVADIASRPIGEIIGKTIHAKSRIKES